MSQAADQYTSPKMNPLMRLLYEKACFSPSLHNELLYEVTKNTKTPREYAKAIEKLWKNMCSVYHPNSDPAREVFCKKGHDCRDNQYHVAWESMPSCLQMFDIENRSEIMYEHYWSFSAVVFRWGQ